ncbi:hypothetical protein GIB67_031992 [Kingdonia uniflora]|uniref:Uncharacterized protein n=1 Tax=Kingdonia uniflora TaxID=39325 RepID=A0A7J7MWB2_9MAGN|nr:hypothetical protein GIB67_031992 [Kingdonia uniflora]
MHRGRTATNKPTLAQDAATLIDRVSSLVDLVEALGRGAFPPQLTMILPPSIYDGYLKDWNTTVKTGKRETPFVLLPGNRDVRSETPMFDMAGKETLAVLEGLRIAAIGAIGKERISNAEVVVEGEGDGRIEWEREERIRKPKLQYREGETREKDSVQPGVTYPPKFLVGSQKELDELPFSPSRQEQVEEVEEEYVEVPYDNNSHVDPIEEYFSGAPSECSTIEDDMDGDEFGEEGLRAADDLYSDDIENMVEPTKNSLIWEYCGDEYDKFRCFCLSFKASLDGFKKGYRSENTENWTSFLELLALMLHHDLPITFVSDWHFGYRGGVSKCWMTGLRDLPVCQFAEKLHLKIVTLMFDRRRKAREWSVDDVVPRVKKFYESHKIEYQKYIYR